MTIIGLFAPRTVVIEVGGTGRIRRNVLCGNGILFPQITIISPLIEPVRRGRLRNGGLNIIRAIEYGALTGLK